LFYNKGKQHHTTTYTYTNNHIKSLLNSGSLENNLKSHQLQYVHLIQKTWQLSNVFVYSNTLSFSDTYASRNYEVKNYGLEPKVSYLFSNNASVSCFYSFKNKQNSIGNLETLQQNQWGVICNYLSEKQFTLNAEYAFYTNKFSGNALSPVGFTMLEGLQSGKNATWRLLLQKKLTQYLDININYLGRKSENSIAIHTGTIQLRAYF
jgi:outer membrane protein assembly factor BamA